MRRQTVDAESPDRNNLQVSPGSTFVFVSGLGGKSVRDQSRCSPSSYPYGCNGEWASIYASDQGAKPGALIIDFNVGDDPSKAMGRFINVNGRVIDEFVITTDRDNTAPVGDDQQVTTAEDTDRSITLTGSDADGDDLRFSVLNGPNNGSLGGIAPDLTYTPDADFSGSDSFNFLANDGKTNSAPARVSITVTP